MIDNRYRPQAQVAVNLLRAVLLAVEECGADEELTRIVVTLSDTQQKLRGLFDLPPGQVTANIDPDLLASDLRSALDALNGRDEARYPHVPGGVVHRPGDWLRRLREIASGLEPGQVQWDLGRLDEATGRKQPDPIARSEAQERDGSGA